MENGGEKQGRFYVRVGALHLLYYSMFVSSNSVDLHFR